MGAQTAVGSRAYWAAACALRDPGTVGREGGEATVPAHWAKGAGRGATTDGAVLCEPTRKEITPGTSCAKQATQDQKAIAGADEQTQEFWIEKKKCHRGLELQFPFPGDTKSHTKPSIRRFFIGTSIQTASPPPRIVSDPPPSNHLQCAALETGPAEWRAAARKTWPRAAARD